MENAAPSRIDVMLADANPLVLSAMAEIFERDPRFSLVATAATAEGLLGAVMRVPVALAVIDWDLPALGGGKLVEVLREQPGAPRVVVYGEEAGDLPRRAMTAGAAGFAPRSGAADALLSVCAEVAAGRMVFPFVDVRELRRDPIHTLSVRERAMLEALAKGLSNRELSRELGISANTVKFHLSNVYDKLQVRNRTQAIAFYYASREARGR